MAAVILDFICISNSSPGTKNTTKSCNISGVPRIIHTNTLEKYDSGLNVDIVAYVIISPRGIASNIVVKNNSRFCPNPSNSDAHIEPPGPRPEIKFAILIQSTS